MLFDRFGCNILHLALKHVGMVSLILEHIRTTEHRSDCSNITNEGASPSHKCNCPTIYPGIDEEDCVGHTAAQTAMDGSGADVISLLLQVCPSAIDSPRRIVTWDGKKFGLHNTVLLPWERPLHFAIRNSQLELFQILLNTGANVELLDSTGQSPLACAVHWKNQEAIKALLVHGANFMTIYNTKDSSRTLLEEAVLSPTILDVLVTSRPSLDFSMSKDAVFVLRQAQGFGRWDTIRTLILQCTKRDRIGRILNEEETFFYALRSTPEILDFLLQSGANANATFAFNHVQQDFKDWKKPIHLVACYGRIDLAAILLKHGANMLSKAANGMLPLHLAVRYANLATVRYFLGQSIECIREAGDAPKDGNFQYTDIIKKAMKIACKRGSVDIVELLLQRSNLKSASLAPDALRIAYQFGRRDVTEYLLNDSTFFPPSYWLQYARRMPDFESFEEEEGRPGNSLKDYEDCITLVARKTAAQIRLRQHLTKVLANLGTG